MIRGGREIRLLSLILILGGVALLTYVGLSYYAMWSAQRRLAHEFDVQQRRAAIHLAAAEMPRVADDIADDNDGLTRLSIPKINLIAVVVEGTSHHKLLLGPGHMEQTAAPGETGNAVITAHRDTFFRHIYELNKGDVVTVERGGRTYTYAVTGKKIVDPNDLSVVKPSGDARLTLITCYPTYYIGPAPERLVVFSKRLDNTITATK